MSTFGDNLRKIRKEKGMTQDELAAVLGTSKQVLSRYENGQRSPKVSVVSEFAEKLGVPINALTDAASPFGKPIDGLIPRSQVRTRHVPILGDTAAGEPVIANREYDEWVEVPDDGHHFDAALRVTGDSMAPKYQKGDLVFVRYQEDVQDGQIAVICLNDGVTLKRLYHIPDGVQLLSENRDYPPMVFTAADGNAHLVGLAVGVLHWDD